MYYKYFNSWTKYIKQDKLKKCIFFPFFFKIYIYIYTRQNVPKNVVVKLVINSFFKDRLRIRSQHYPNHLHVQGQKCKYVSSESSTNFHFTLPINSRWSSATNLSQIFTHSLTSWIFKVVSLIVSKGFNSIFISFHF